MRAWGSAAAISSRMTELPPARVVDQAAIKRDNFRADAHAGKFGLDQTSRAVAQTAAQTGVFGEPDEGIGEGWRIIGRNKQGADAGPRNLAAAGDVRRDQWTCARCSFQETERQPFAARRQDRNVGLGPNVANVANVAKKLDAFQLAPFHQLRFWNAGGVRRIGIAGNQQPERTAALSQQPMRRDQGRHALVMQQSSDKCDRDWLVRLGQRLQIFSIDA